jgi:hypothetical protein
MLHFLKNSIPAAPEAASEFEPATLPGKKADKKTK